MPGFDLRRLLRKKVYGGEVEVMVNREKKQLELSLKLKPFCRMESLKSGIPI